MFKKQTSVSHSSTESEIIFGRWIEIGLDSRSRFMGSACFCPWKHDSETAIERGNPLSAVTQVTGQASNLEECSTF